MEIVKNDAVQPDKSAKKLSYEELDKKCSELFQQNQYLMMELQQRNVTMMFRRLDYLFKVLEHAETIKDADFIGDCIDEIKQAMTIKAEPNQES